jgi:hypothetical protein
MQVQKVTMYRYPSISGNKINISLMMVLLSYHPKPSVQYGRVLCIYTLLYWSVRYICMITIYQYQKMLLVNTYADQLTLLMSELYKQNEEHHSLKRSCSQPDVDIPTVLSDITA